MEFIKAPVSEMGESHGLGPCHLLGLQKEICTASWLKNKQTSAPFKTLEEETIFHAARFSSGWIYSVLDMLLLVFLNPEFLTSIYSVHTCNGKKSGDLDSEQL